MHARHTRPPTGTSLSHGGGPAAVKGGSVTRMLRRMECGGGGAPVPPAATGNRIPSHFEERGPRADPVARPRTLFDWGGASSLFIHAASILIATGPLVEAQQGAVALAPRQRGRVGGNRAWLDGTGVDAVGTPARAPPATDSAQTGICLVLESRRITAHRARRTRPEMPRRRPPRLCQSCLLRAAG